MENETDLNITDSGIQLLDQPVNIPGLIGVIVFYLIILGVGIFASWKSKSWKTSDSEEVMLAGRNIGMFVGIFTMTATWVGGGYINGTAEVVFTEGYGLVWCQAPVGYAISLVLGGLLFAKQMRSAGYVTMLDPFQQRYGRVMTALLYFPALLGEIFWSAAILSALGASLAVILGLDHTIAVIISACIAVLYTIMGGLYSVAFTDVIQLICIFIGLWLGVGFALFNPAVTNIGETARADVGSWLGSLKYDYWLLNYADSALLLIFGGIPWQVYFQRVLSSKSATGARVLSFTAGFGCIIMAIPAVLIGAIAKSADWNATEYAKYREIPIPEEDYKLALPLVLQYLTPTAVSVIGLGAVSAAVMSSADSSVLSASSMFAHNIYAPLRKFLACGRPASSVEVLWTLRVAVLLVAAAATVMAIMIQSIYGLWYLCADLVYCILFPQLLSVIHIPLTNTYGSFFGFWVGLVLRFLGGEPLLKLDPVIRYWWYDEESGYQLFPFKTFTMVISFLTIIIASILARWILTSDCMPEYMDFAGAYYNQDDEDDPDINFEDESDKKSHKLQAMNGQQNPGYSSSWDNVQGFD